MCIRDRTSTYEPKDAYVADLQKEFEPAIEEDYAAFLKWLAGEQQRDFTKLRAISNIDIMLPSPLEFELQKRRGQARHVILAEFNPRLSEFSDPVVGKTLFYPQLEQTTETFREINRKGVYTYAKWPLPPHIDPVSYTHLTLPTIYSV